MSLRLSISATEQKTSLIINDCTGKYSSSNQGGFGVPNPKVSDIETSKLEITIPSGDVKTITINVGDFPNEKGIGYEILPYMVGMQELESGEYKIKLEIAGTEKSGRPFIKSALTRVILTNSVSCCVDKLISKNIGTENAEKKKEMIELNNLINSMNESIRCGRYSTSKKIIDYLKEKCECCNCKS